VPYWTDPGKDTPAPTPIQRALALLTIMSEELDEVRRLLSTA